MTGLKTFVSQYIMFYAQRKTLVSILISITSRVAVQKQDSYLHLFLCFKKIFYDSLGDMVIMVLKFTVSKYKFTAYHHY